MEVVEVRDLRRHNQWSNVWSATVIYQGPLFRYQHNLTVCARDELEAYTTFINNPIT